MESIINFLNTGPKSTFEFRKELGVYPRKKLHQLEEQNFVEKHVVDRRVIWSITERDVPGEVQQEILSSFKDFVDELESNPIEDEADAHLEEIKEVLDDVTEPFVFKHLRIAGAK